MNLTNVEDHLSAKSYRNDQQDATVLDNLLFHCSLTAQHVSSDIIAHHQELLNCNYSFWFYSCLSLPAAVMAQPRQRPATQFHLIHDSSRQQYWFDNTWRCMYSFCSWWRAKEPPETCRAIHRNKQIEKTLHHVGCTLEISQNTLHIRYQPAHVSTPRCHIQGVF